MSHSILKNILLFLIFPSMSRSKPQRQNCFLGQCNQNNIGGGRGFGSGGLGLFGNQRFPSFNPSLSIQNCVGSQCNQNNVGAGATSGGSFFGNRGVGSGFPSFNPSLNIQNCRGSQCGQNNLRRKRNAAPQSSEESSHPAAVSQAESLSSVPVTTVKKYVCAGALVSSTCINSHCRIICADGVKYDADCGKLGTSLTSSSSSPGKTVVTVTCGGAPISFPSCFPFCSGHYGGAEGGSSQSSQPSLSSQISSYTGGCSTRSLTSCISACPQTSQYQACVSNCLATCSQQKYATNLFPLSPFPPCFPFCGPF